jgi:hypothetical protein
VRSDETRWMATAIELLAVVAVLVFAVARSMP